LYISLRCGSVATRSSRIASTVAVSSGGSAERSPISPWPSFGQHETIKAPERADLKAVPCPSPRFIMASMPWMEGAPEVRITDLSISTFAHTSAGIFPLFSGLGGQIGGARLKHNGPLTAGCRERPLSARLAHSTCLCERPLTESVPGTRFRTRELVLLSQSSHSKHRRTALLRR
jgi:hypothetical protein